MKKIITIVTLLSICIAILGANKLILALDLGDSIEISGNSLLPSLFYEHNLYNHKTEYGDIIYCLDPEKTGTEASSYRGNVVNNLDFYSEEQIAILSSAIINGFPNSLPGEPSRYFSNNELHGITAMAIRALCMEFKGLSKGKTAENYINIQYGEHSAKLQCINLIKYAKNNPYYEKYNTISVKCISGNTNLISEDKTKVLKEYIIEGTNISGPVTIAPVDKNIGDIILPQNLTIGQKFNIAVPIGKTYTSINEDIVVSGKSNSGLVYIKAGISNRQNYMGIINVNQDIKTTFEFNLSPSIAHLKIIKKDIDTIEALPGAIFRVWSKQPKDINDVNDLIGTFKTNDQGFLELNNILELGNYYIHEINPPIGYFSQEPSYYENIEVKKLGSSYEKTIYNKHLKVLDNFIQIEGYKQVASHQPVQYKIFKATNISNVSLSDFTINIPIPYDFYELNKSISIGEFEEKQGYLMYLLDTNSNIHEIKKSYKDNADYLLSKSGNQKSKNVQGIFTNTDSELIDISKAGLKELTIKLAPESEGSKFKTPIFGEGSYSIFIKNNEGEYLLGNNYDGKKVNEFICTDLRSYRIVFDTPIFCKQFNSGSFSADTISDELYTVIVDTNKRKNIIIQDNLLASKRNILNISDFRISNLLLDDEIIYNVSIVFNDSVKPGFSLINPIIINGTSKDLKGISVNKFDGNGNNLYYSNFVEINGVYLGEKVRNQDEWDTSSYSKVLKLQKGKLPNTGSYKYLITGVVSLNIGALCIIKRRNYHE